jgi:histone deacetylase 1/2
VIIRCNSFDPLYLLHLPAVVALTAASTFTIWHHRLGHPSQEVLAKLPFSCNKDISSSFCHACQLGRHTRLPFRASSSRDLSRFDLIHCDLWTSPVTSVSGYKYHLVILDDHKHYLWTFPLRLKSDTFSTLANFFSYVTTQFGTTVKAVQCDNGREFDNSHARTFSSTHGVLLHMLCPYTSAQNGRAERIIRSINNTVHSLLF